METKREIELVKSGDKKTVDAVLRRYHNSVFHSAKRFFNDCNESCYGVLCPRLEAGDVAQDVLLYAWQHIGEWRGVRLGAWLAKITKSKCINRIRDIRLRKETSIDWLAEQFAWSTPEMLNAEEYFAYTARLLGEMDEFDMELLPDYLSVRESIAEAIERLPDSEQEVMRLKVRGLTPEEIGCELGVTRNNVDVTLCHARARMERMLTRKNTGPCKMTPKAVAAIP